MIMIDQDDTDYSESTERGQMLKDHGTADNGLTWDDVGFSLAVGVYDAIEGEYIHDTENFKDHLELTVTYRSWFINPDIGFVPKEESIPTHVCGSWSDEGMDPPNEIQE